MHFIVVLLPAVVYTVYLVGVCQQTASATNRLMFGHVELVSIRNRRTRVACVNVAYDPGPQRRHALLSCLSVASLVARDIR